MWAPPSGNIYFYENDKLKFRLIFQRNFNPQMKLYRINETI